MSDETSKWRQIAGWAAVSISTAVASFWAFWGSIENFHEGWYFAGVWQNLELMFVQYLSLMLIVMLVSAVALAWPRTSIPLFGLIALAAAWLFHWRNLVGIEMIVVPLVLLGVLYHSARPQPRRWAWRCLLWLPLITAVICGVYPGWRAMHRFDDGNYGMRLIEGNGVTLVWAPEGPGWPSQHASWPDAKRNCAHLVADGRSLAEQPQNIWRLPTADEAVRSMVFRGHNAGGTWDPGQHRANYRMQPVKDSPLWKVHSQVIYWWTDTQADSDKAYRIAYNGYVFPFAQKGWGDYWAYRCVCEPSKLSLPINK